ncbi:Retrotransposable element Tf2 155 kDa protein type 1 [Rhizoctonia solani AG-1 IB]|uniref:Retrotransposable element Tf2 155 kDa protein type 1 n=1 Tax=Thanatephorus cucumeris (strain AG1-IB / isolate 7/3/14) TaxID=1108050 RepID=M5CC17_THACB|nr:Retrotransposable element Tf2 155 kDa protein type 1 [Rhizoctonia solani AG-1 IB]
MIPEELFANVAKEEQDSPLQNQIKDKQQKDPSLDDIIEFLTVKQENAPPSIKKAYRDYRRDDEILLFQDKILVPDNNNLKQEILKLYHDSPLAGHPGQQQTLELVSRYYTWPGKKGWIKTYVESCDTCQRMRRAKVPSLPLKPLEVPLSPFHTISYDFITGFPKSKGMDAILVVIDSFTKFGHFIPTLSKAIACDLADLFVTNVWKLHGLLIKTICDRGTTFTGKFLRGLYKRLGIDPHFSSAYHPESDGQTERVNQFIKHFLCSYVRLDQTDWLHWLTLAEFAYNNAKHSATQKSPFQLLFGQNPVMNPSELRIDVPEANDLADKITSEWKEAKSALRISKERMKGPDKPIPISFAEGEKVWLDGRNMNLKTKSPKLNHRRLGPFKVTRKLSKLAYKLELPETLKIHNIFYAGLLSKVFEDPGRPLLERPPPVTVEGEEEYIVEAILDNKRRGNKWWYLVKWEGYGPEHNSWEPKENLEHSKDLIKKYYQDRLRRACDSAKSS